MKQILKSKTIWKAVLLGVASVVVAVLTELDMIAYIGLANMVVDFILRLITTVPISSK